MEEVESLMVKRVEVVQSIEVRMHSCTRWEDSFGTEAEGWGCKAVGTGSCNMAGAMTCGLDMFQLW